MSSEKNAFEIAMDYMKKSGIHDFEIKQVIDKIYKWRVEAQASSEKFLIEISKSGESVIKFEKL